MIGLIYVCFPFKKKYRKWRSENNVLCLSHVAISFDGRIKKCANQLIKLGLNVKIVKPVDAQEDVDFERSGLSPEVEIKSVGLSGVFYHFPCVFDLCMFFYVLFSQEKFLHCHDINTAFIGLVASRMTGKVLVCDLHEWKSETTGLDKKNQFLLQKKLYQFLEKLILKNADFVITVNETISNEMKFSFDIKRDILIVKNIPEIYELDSYNIRNVLHIKDDAFIVYYIGQIAPYRNVDKILIAVSQCPDVFFVFQGTIQPSYLKELKDLIEELNISDRVFYLPPIPHHLIPSACQGADVGLFTCHAVAKSMHYSLPNKLFEYAMGELPIISDDLPVMRFYIEKYEIGTLVDSKDPKTISNAFNVYLLSEKLKEQKKNIMLFKEKIKKNEEMKNVYSAIYIKESL